MRPLSGFTRRRNQKKTSWVGSREQALIRIHHVPGILTKDGKANSNDTQPKADMEKNNSFMFLPWSSEYLRKHDIYLFCGILATRLWGQVFSTPCASMNTGYRVKWLRKVEQMVGVMSKLTAAPRLSTAPKCHHRQESLKPLNLQRSLTLAALLSCSRKSDKAGQLCQKISLP